MKILFISSRDVRNKTNGGSQCTNRNFLSFTELIGDDNVELHDLSKIRNKAFYDRILKWIRYLCGFSEGLSPRVAKVILNSSKDKDCVFIDSSQFGILSYLLKKDNYKGRIICFFHNVEFSIKLQNFKSNPLSFWRVLLTYYNERKACRFSDSIVVLNKRDRDGLHRLYGIKEANIIPISMKDTFVSPVNEYTSVPPTFIFIGNNWYANIHGLKWFVDNVLDKVNIKLQIIGSGMDVLHGSFNHPKIDFLGYVPDISELINKADYVLSPIFLGGGMKVKTCESLMYGKNIIGTTEAFEGYDVDANRVGAICNTKEEFIDAINKYCLARRNKFNVYSRKTYLEKYSFQATLKKFDELLKD